MRVLGLIAIAAMMMACSTVDLTPQSGYQVGATEIQNKGRTFRAGDHVVIKTRAGTFKPKDTRHSIDISAEPGRTGIVLGGVKPASGSMQSAVLLVRFDAQVWHDTSSSMAEVALESFEATIHADYMEK